tara:strand:+ start:4455 stop:4784 length:330 start_codon:yes stop_codon:yes gene_type:complete
MKMKYLFTLLLLMGLSACSSGKPAPEELTLSYKVTFGSAKQAAEAKLAVLGPAIKKIASEEVELVSEPYRENNNSKSALIQIKAPLTADPEEIKSKLKQLDGVVEVDVY